MNIEPDKQKEAWERLPSRAEWVPIIGLQGISRVRTGADVDFVFELTDNSFTVPLEMATSQQQFRKRVYSETGFMIPNQTGAIWDETCMLFYLAAGNERVNDRRNGEAIDLLVDFLERGTNKDSAPDDDSEQTLLEQVRAGTLKAYRDTAGRWVFKLADLTAHARRHGVPLTRPQLVMSLHDLGFQPHRNKVVRLWTSPEQWGLLGDAE